MKILEPNINEAKRELVEKPLFATSVERVLILNELKDKYLDLPQPLRFSKILSVLLSRVSTPIEEYDLIAGRCVDRELTDREERAFQELQAYKEIPYKKAFMSSGHCAYSWDMVVEKGLVGLRDDVRTRLDAERAEDKRIFLTAILEIYDAIADYLMRYSEEAEKRGMTEAARNLKVAATGVPDTFASALQLLWVITLIDCAYITKNPTLTVGRLDRILYPLYKSEVRRGTLTRERAAEYITDYYCKHNLIMGRGEHQVGDETNSTTFDRICNFDAPQYLLIAGTDEKGELSVNELTEIFAECIEPSFKNPVVVVRYVKGMSESCPRLWQILVEKATSSASLMFYNDGNVYSAFRRIGLPEEDARNYAHFGCNWCSPGDNSAWLIGGPSSVSFEGAFVSEEEKNSIIHKYMRMNTEHGWPEDFMIVARELAEREPDSVTIEDFYELFFDRMSDFIDRKLDNAHREVEVRKRKPSAALTFGDCFFRDSIKTAECFAAGAKYHFTIQSFQMFATVVDSFVAVDQLVMREKKMTLKRLIEATERDFEGYDEILALCRRADKYGMDTPLSNYHARRLSHRACELVIEKNRPYLEREGLFMIPCMQSDTWHLKTGILYGATPDGRRANTPFSQNTRPSNGACVNGMTAMFNSMLNLPTDGLVSGALNLDIDARQFRSENGRVAFGAMLSSYFDRGGLHAQVSCVNASDLVDAKKDPERHRDIRVRVTGYSGIFVDMCETLQDDIIERMK